MSPHEPHFAPLDCATLDRVADQTLPAVQLRTARLHLDEHDLPQLPFIESVEDHEVHRLSQELRVLRIERKARQIRRELLEDLPARHRLASRNRIASRVAG